MANQRKSSDRSQNEDLAVEQLFRSNVANIVPVELEKEMRSSFIDYAMSVITERALPDVRDGLKPVHRRILYSMLTQGFTPDKPYRKCATTVGDV
ncbi:MAG TPA: DNA gyrase subunit A, partial [Clostridiaceae bacterium]|nr:DNA gyrase subunit A [Clostridiaceae bacterium]